MTCLGFLPIELCPCGGGVLFPTANSKDKKWAQRWACTACTSRKPIVVVGTLPHGNALDRRKNLVGFSESSPSVELGLDILNVINQRTGFEPATKGFQLARSFYIWSIEENTRYDFSMLKTYSVFFFTEFTNVFPSASPFPSGMLSFFFPIMFCHQIDSFFLRVVWLQKPQKPT